MQYIKKKISSFLTFATLLLVIFFATTPTDIIAGPTAGAGRVRSCDNENDINNLDFNPTYGGKDIEFAITNPVCITVAATTYAVAKAAISNMVGVCAIPAKVNIFPNPIYDSALVVRGTYRGAVRAAAGDGSCAAAAAGAVAGMASFVGQLAIIWALADIAYDNTEICGHDWYTDNGNEYNRYSPGKEQTDPMQYIDNNGDPQAYPPAIDSIKKIIDRCHNSGDSGGTDPLDEHLTEGLHTNCDQELSMKSQHYREYFYGGVEVIDNPTGSKNPCKDPYLPTNSADYNEAFGSSRRTFFIEEGDDPNKIFEYHSQRYYMRGFEEPNFNCQKYNLKSSIDPVTGQQISEQRKQDFLEALQCCQDRAANYVCIRYHEEDYFCPADSKCTLTEGAKPVTFQTTSHDDKSRICVESYSLCPYNFTVKGGTEICDYYKDGKYDDNQNFIPMDPKAVAEGRCGNGASEVRDGNCELNNKAGACKNHCQHMTHCAKTSNIYIHDFSEASPYLSEACINFTGDSRNQVSFGTGFFQGSMRNFSAPIVQCLKETLENLFFNRAGHSKCRSAHEDDAIDITGSCPSGFSYEKGEDVYHESFFETLQRTLNLSIRVALSLVIMFYGMKILAAVGEIKKKDLVILIVKIALVMYFATGSGWKDSFFDGIYKTSDFLSTMVFKIQMPEEEDKRDGCQFGKVYTSLALGDSNIAEQSNVSYPEGKEYLAIWDTLDCKLARYMGFGPEASAANIAKLMVAGWLIGSIGTYFVACLFFIAFLLISVTIRAVHIFLASTIAIILLIFISPITITCILTSKTKGIFDGWLKQMLSFALQPMILFVYLAIFVSILDKSLVGDAIYKGNPPVKIISCSKYCADINGKRLGDPDAEPPIGVDCDIEGREVVNPKANSLECMINSDSYSRFPGLEIIGISIPFLLDLFLEDTKEKMLTLVRGLVIIYFLYKFMDEVPNIASQLFGGAQLPQSTMSPNAMLRKTASKLKGLQQRGVRGAKGAARGGFSSTKKGLTSGGGKKETSDKKPSSESAKGSGETGGGDGESEA